MAELETAPETARELLFGDEWEYAPAPQSADHVRLEDRYGPFIDGEFREVDEYFPSISPATEETIAEVGLANEAIVDDAVSAARSAYESRWRDLPGAERAKYIYRIGRMIKEKSRELAVLESMDGGKPIRESRDMDIPLVAAHFFHYAGRGRAGRTRACRPSRRNERSAPPRAGCPCRATPGSACPRPSTPAPQARGTSP